MMTAHYLESDADWAALIDYLRRETPLRTLSSIEAHAVFRKLRQLGYRIQEPVRHPSGHPTTERATTTVTTEFVRLHIDSNGKRHK